MRLTLVLLALLTLSSTACPKGDNCLASGDVAGADGRDAVDAANAFLLSLDYAKRDKASFAFDANEKRGWSNLPDGVLIGGRSGLSLADMTDEQCEQAAALLFASTSPQSAQQFVNVMRADDHLATAEAPNFLRWSSDNYYFSVFGTPSPTEPWAWSVNGHHLAFLATFANGQMTAAPHFLGIEPQEIVVDGEKTRPLDDERRVGFEVANALVASDQLEAARIEHPSGGVLLGAGQDGLFPDAAEGVAVGAVDADIKALVRNVVSTWLLRLPPGPRDVWLASYDADADDAHFAWSGDVTDDSVDAYYRVHSPSVWIELSFEGAIASSSNGQPHFHAILRDPRNDYGAALVGN